ncbi:MAG: hypothetical protein V1659_01255 [Candidatus Woesearchaeota archaeon]
MPVHYLVYASVSSSSPADKDTFAEADYYLVSREEAAQRGELNRRIASAIGRGETALLPSLSNALVSLNNGEDLRRLTWHSGPNKPAVGVLESKVALLIQIARNEVSAGESSLSAKDRYVHTENALIFYARAADLAYALGYNTTSEILFSKAAEVVAVNLRDKPMLGEDACWWLERAGDVMHQTGKYYKASEFYRAAASKYSEGVNPAAIKAAAKSAASWLKGRQRCLKAKLDNFLEDMQTEFAANTTL